MGGQTGGILEALPGFIMIVVGLTIFHFVLKMRGIKTSGPKAFAQWWLWQANWLFRLLGMPNVCYHCKLRLGWGFLRGLKGNRWFEQLLNEGAFGPYTARVRADGGVFACGACGRAGCLFCMGVVGTKTVMRPVIDWGAWNDAFMNMQRGEGFRPIGDIFHHYEPEEELDWQHLDCTDRSLLRKMEGRRLLYAFWGIPIDKWTPSASTSDLSKAATLPREGTAVMSMSKPGEKMEDVNGLLRLTTTELEFEGPPDVGTLEFPLSSIELVVKTPLFQSFTIHMDKDTVYAFNVKKDAREWVKAIKDTQKQIRGQ